MLERPSVSQAGEDMMDVLVGQQPAYLGALQVGPHEYTGKLPAVDVVPVFKAKVDARYGTD